MTSTFPEATVETPYGTLRAWATGPEHVGFSGPDEYDGAGKRLPAVVINGVPHYLRIDMHPESHFLTPEGHSKGMTWGKHGWSTDWHFSLRRSDRWDKDHASPAANKKVQHELIPLLCNWIVSDEGQKLLEVASQQKAEADVAAARARVEKAKAELAAAEAALVELNVISLKG